MAVNFPQNPQEGDSFVSGNYIFVFTDDKWVSAAVNPNYRNIQGATGATGPQGADGGGGDPGVRYQQGTWTPVAGVAGGFSNLNTCGWTRIGNQVTVFGRWKASSASADNMQFSGVPYTSSTNLNDGGYSSAIQLQNGVTAAGNNETRGIIWFLPNNASYLVAYFAPEVNSTYTLAKYLDVQNPSDVVFSLTYTTDDTTFAPINSAVVTEDIEGTGGGSGTTVNYNGASAWGSVAADGTLQNGLNVTTTKTGNGQYTVSFVTPMANDTYAVTSAPNDSDQTVRFQNRTINGFEVNLSGDVNAAFSFAVHSASAIAPPSGVGADAWGVVNGDSTLLNGFNVTSAYSSNPGQYQITFNTPMPNDLYSVVANANAAASLIICVITGQTENGFVVRVQNNAGTLSNTSFNFTVHASSTVTPTYTWTREGTTLKPVNESDDVVTGNYNPTDNSSRGCEIGAGAITAQRLPNEGTTTLFRGLKGNDTNFEVIADGSAQFGPETAAKVSMEGMGTDQGELIISNPTGSNSFNCFRVVSQGTNTIVFKQGGNATFNVGNGSFNVGTNATNTSVDLRNSNNSVAVSLTNDANCFKTGGGSWSASASAARLKDVVGDVEKDQAWSLLRDMELKRYWFKTETERTGVPWMGLIAEEAAALDPELKIVTNETDDEGEIWSYNMSVLQMKSMAALSFALTRIEELEAKIDLLEGN